MPNRAIIWIIMKRFSNMKRYRFTSIKKEESLNGTIFYIVQLKKTIPTLTASLPLPDGSPLTITQVKELRVLGDIARIDFKKKEIRFEGRIDVTKPKFKMIDTQAFVITPPRAWAVKRTFSEMGSFYQMENRKRLTNALADLFRN